MGDSEVLHNVEFTLDKNKDILLFPKGMAISLRVQPSPTLSRAGTSRLGRRPSPIHTVKAFVPPCKRPRDSANNPQTQKQMHGSSDVSGSSSAQHELIDDYIQTMAKLKKRKERLQELESRLASAKKTEGQQSLKPLTDKWRKAIISCLNAFHSHERCPINPDTGERIAIDVLAEKLVGVDLELLGISYDDLLEAE